MTNAHVVSGAQRVQVVLPPANADGTLATALSGKMNIVPARIVGITTELDLALLKVDGMKLPALPLATYSQVRQGETVFAFGSPIGLRNTLTHGLVSAVARQIDPDSPLIYVQTDAPINPGNSGGPLVNIRGEVVGINTFIISQSGGNDGLGFAIPSATVRTVFRQLKQYGQLRRQEVGMSLQTITPDMADVARPGAGLRRHRLGRLARRPGGGGRPEGRRHPGVGGRSARGQPADGQLQLPPAETRRRTVQLVVLRGTAEQTPERRGRSRSGASSTPCRRWPTRRRTSSPSSASSASRSIRASPPRRSGLRGSVRHHRRRPRRRRDERGAAAAEGRHPQHQQRADRRRCRRCRDAVRALKPGAPVTLQIQREGRLMYVSFTLD